jgi:hypothetical protein
LAARDRYASGSDAKPLCEQPPDGLVGFAVDRRSRYTHEQPTLALTGDLVAPGAGLNPHLEPAHAGWRALLAVEVGWVFRAARKCLQLDRVAGFLAGFGLGQASAHAYVLRRRVLGDAQSGLFRR